MRAVILLSLRAYKRLVSPLLPPACRFHPTCSEYCAEAVARFGAARGLWLGLRRLLRCQPLGTAGFDPVPQGAEPSIAAVPAAPAPDRSNDADPPR